MTDRKCWVDKLRAKEKMTLVSGAARQTSGKGTAPGDYSGHPTHSGQLTQTKPEQTSLTDHRALSVHPGCIVLGTPLEALLNIRSTSEEAFSYLERGKLLKSIFMPRYSEIWGSVKEFDTIPGGLEWVIQLKGQPVLARPVVLKVWSLGVPKALSWSLHDHNYFHNTI